MQNFYTACLLVLITSIPQVEYVYTKPSSHKGQDRLGLAIGPSLAKACAQLPEKEEDAATLYLDPKDFHASKFIKIYPSQPDHRGPASGIAQRGSAPTGLRGPIILE